jgi:hypothetical protein
MIKQMHNEKTYNLSTQGEVRNEYGVLAGNSEGARPLGGMRNR